MRPPVYNEEVSLLLTFNNYAYPNIHKLYIQKSFFQAIKGSIERHHIKNDKKKRVYKMPFEKSLPDFSNDQSGGIF
ncbi:MAG TPA: hypothetical protein VIQ00_05710 [Chitinophagaceae bacterium]|jgi:hypothetical protein